MPAGAPRQRRAKGRPSGARAAGSSRARCSGKPGPQPQHRFTPGARVFHQKFGNGNVLAVDGDKLRIAFDHAGEKMVIASFVAPV